MQKNLVALEGVLKRLDPNLNMWQLLEPWFTEWAKDNLNPIAKGKRKIREVLQELLLNHQNHIDKKG